MGLRNILDASENGTLLITEVWWIVGMLFLSAFLLAILNVYLRSVTPENTIIQVHTPRIKYQDEYYASSIVINITHRSSGIPDLELTPSAVSHETKKTL